MSEVTKKCNEHTGDTWYEVAVNPDKWYESTWLGCKMPQEVLVPMPNMPITKRWILHWRKLQFVCIGLNRQGKTCWLMNAM